MRTIAIACGIVVLVIVGIVMLVPHFLPSLFSSIARPFWRMEFSIASGSLDSPEALLAQNEDLKRQMAALMVDQQSAQAVDAENSQLLSLLGRPSAMSNMASSSDPSASSTATSFAYPKPVPGRTLAAVLVRPPFSPFDEIIIDIGSDQGIIPGAKIYAPGNVLIGTTTDVFSQTAKVRLLSSPGETYPVLIGSGSIPAVAVGRGGGQYSAQVPQASKVARGDAVSDSSLSDAPFGIVSEVFTDPAEPFETVLFAPPVNVYQLRWVLADTSSTIPAKIVPAKSKKSQ